MKKFVEIKTEELKNVNGGELIITGAMVYTGLKLAGGAFALGYSIGKAIKGK